MPSWPTQRKGRVRVLTLTPIWKRPGSEQTGRRPVVLVSHHGFNQISAWRSIIVVPITTSASGAKPGRRSWNCLVALPAFRRLASPYATR
jgi:mRNA-degrading endonuclease toxin of MazEF toxin-antitoxin module